MSPQGSTFGGIRLVVGWRGWWPTVRSRNSPSPFVIASPGPRAPRRSFPPPGRESAERTGCNDAAESRAVAVAPPLHLLRRVENEELKQQLAAAHRAGRRQAGVETVKEQCRDVQRFRVAEDLWRDLRYGLRRLLARPDSGGRGDRGPGCRHRCERRHSRAGRRPASASAPRHGAESSGRRCSRATTPAVARERIPTPTSSIFGTLPATCSKASLRRRLYLLRSAYVSEARPGSCPPR